MMLLKSWWVKASRVMPVRRDMVAAKSMRARLPGVLKHQHSEVIALSKDMSIAGHMKGKSVWDSHTFS